MTETLHWPVARLRITGSGLWILAGGLAAVGTFLPLIEQNSSYRQQDADSGVAITLWGLQGSQSNLDVFPPLGIPVVVSVVLLVAAALLGLASTRQHPATAPVLAARLIGTAGTGLLLGSVAQAFLVFRVFNQGTDEALSNPFGSSTGLGAWLLLVSGLLAITAIVLMLVPKIAKRGEEPETPPMGIPVVRVLEPEYEEPFEADEVEQQPTDPKG